jgi:hypothetical protein
MTSDLAIRATLAVFAAAAATGCAESPTPVKVGADAGSDTIATACPTTLPIAGSNCDAPATCLIEDAPDSCKGTADITVTCVAKGDGIRLWQFTLPQCNGDPAACSDHTHPTVCTADTSCRYLAPGCGEANEPVWKVGCYSGFDCAGDCAAGTTCTTVTSNPCLSFCDGCAVCGACGQQVQLCL